MGPIAELTEMLARLPGLGPRQARRVVQYLLSKDTNFRQSLAGLIETISAKTAQCRECYRFTDPNPSGICSICADHNRDQSVLMVVEHDVDIDAMEASLTYRGKYFVLGGLLNLVKQRKGKEIRGTELLQSLAERIQLGLKEIIFALATTPEGDFTSKELLREVTTKYPTLKTTLLGRGLSVGAELEYADPETLRNALKNRS